MLLVKALDNIATVAEIEALLDHFYRKLAVQKMTEPEVIAVRSYTGPLYVKQNGSLRFASGAFPEAMTEHLQGNKYINTIYANSSGMRKMSHANCIPRNRRVYRGIHLFHVLHVFLALSLAPSLALCLSLLLRFALRIYRGTYVSRSMCADLCVRTRNRAWSTRVRMYGLA